jgi:hypothetical protein
MKAKRRRRGGQQPAISRRRTLLASGPRRSYRNFTSKLEREVKGAPRRPSGRMPAAAPNSSCAWRRQERACMYDCTMRWTAIRNHLQSVVATAWFPVPSAQRHTFGQTPVASTHPHNRYRRARQYHLRKALRRERSSNSEIRAGSVRN